jgi:ACS family hexuronate transporter-like MFS transporter
MTTDATPGRFRWTICALLVGATTINYLDRQILGLLKQPLMADLGFGEAEYAQVVTAFQVAYAFGLAGFGRLIDRWGTRWALAWAMVCWSLAAMAHAFARGPWSLGAVRLALGLGEAGNYPAANKAVAEWFPRQERALAMGLVNIGANLGAIVGPLLVPLVAVHWGWQGAMVATGTIGLVWLFAWLPLYRHPTASPHVGGSEQRWITQDEEPAGDGTLSWGAALRQRRAWVFAVGKFLTDCIWWFYLFWLPGWLMTAHHIDLKNLGWPLVAVYVMATIGALIAGIIPARLLRRGWSLNAARKTTLLICACGALPIAVVTLVPSLPVAVALVGLAAAAHQGFSANLFSTVSDLFPRGAVATITGFGGLCGALGSILFAQLTGALLSGDPTAYGVLFVIGSLAYLTALAAMHLLMPRFTPPERGTL